MVRNEITVAGVMVIWNSEYTPTVRRMSWTTATSAATAIRASRRQVM